MGKIPHAILASGIALMVSAQAVSAATAKLPPNEWVRRQVKMAGYDYDALTHPKKVFPKCKIRIYTFFNALWLETWKAMAAEYNKFQPNVEIQFVMQSGDYHEKLYTMIVANSQPEICMSEVGHVPYFLGNGLMLPLNAYLKADKWTKIIDQTFPTIIDRFTDDGKLYGMPTDTAPQACVYYNKNTLAASGLAAPPDDWTLNEMVIYAKKLTKPDKKQFGFFTSDWKSIMYTYGGLLVDNYKKPSKFIYNSQKARASLEFYKSLFTSLKIMPEPAKAGDITAGFKSGRIPMYTNGVWDSEALAKIKGLDFDVAQFPKLNEGMPAKVRTGGTALCIVKNTKHQEISWDIIKFMTGPIGQVYTSTAGYAQPAIEPMFWTEVWAKNESIKPANKKMLAAATRNVVYEPDVPNWPDISNVIETEFNKAWAGRQSVDQAINTSLPQSQKIMDEAWARRRKLRGVK
jgi:multiple sugar transport system substrate-binding protein